MKSILLILGLCVVLAVVIVAFSDTDPNRMIYLKQGESAPSGTVISKQYFEAGPATMPTGDIIYPGSSERWVIRVSRSGDKRIVEIPVPKARYDQIEVGQVIKK